MRIGLVSRVLDLWIFGLWAFRCWVLGLGVGSCACWHLRPGYVGSLGLDIPGNVLGPLFSFICRTEGPLPEVGGGG